jgi:hypothetical protein
MGTLNDSSKEVGLEVDTEKTKYMSMSHHLNAGQIYNIKIANTCFENVAQFIYLGTTIANQNLIQEEIKRRLNLGNACYHSSNIFRMMKSRRMRWAGHVARMGEKRNAYRMLVGMPEGKRPLGRPRRVSVVTGNLC